MLKNCLAGLGIVALGGIIFISGFAGGVAFLGITEARNPEWSHEHIDKWAEIWESNNA